MVLTLHINVLLFFEVEGFKGIDKLEKLGLVKRVASENDRRINKIQLTKQALKLQEETMALAEETLNEALEGVPAEHIELCKEVLQKVYDNLK